MRVLDPSTSESYTISLSGGYNKFEITGNNVWLKSSWTIARFNVDELS